MLTVFIYIAWDLLRIDIQGFAEFCSDFLSRQKGYIVSPLCLSGSAVEMVNSNIMLVGSWMPLIIKLPELHFLLSKLASAITVGKDTVILHCLHKKKTYQ